MSRTDNVTLASLVTHPNNISHQSNVVQTRSHLPSTSTRRPINIHSQYGEHTTGELLSANSDPQGDNTNILLMKDESKYFSPYEKLLYDIQYDRNFKAEEGGRCIGFYRIYKDIGLGNFSRVKLAMHLLAKEKVAIKVLDKTKLDDKTQRLLLREITSMEELYHPNIVRLYEVIETARQIHIVTEYAPHGDLYTRINNGGKIPDDEAKYIFAQITAAVDYMHSKGIVHRDIKCENVFFAKEHLIKLGDFGFSTYSEKNQTLTTFCGSPPYAAPELYRDENYIGIYVDIWAMGITLFYMVTALMPFRAENMGKLKKSIIDGHYSIPVHVSNQCQELIHGLLNHEATERWSIRKIRSCSWLAHQQFPRAYEPFAVNLSDYWTYFNESSSYKTIPRTSSIEYETCLRLKKLGITSNVIEKVSENMDNRSFSNHDGVNGTYRILLHRLQKQMNPLERDDSYDRKSDGHDKTGEKSSKQDLNQSSIQSTKVCTIL